MGAADLDALAGDFERDGFVNGGPVIGATELDRLRSDADRFAADMQAHSLADPTLRLAQEAHRQAPQTMPLYREMGQGDAKHHNISDVRHCSPAFQALTENPAIVAMAARILDARTLHVWADTIQYKTALNGDATVWHQDGIYHSIYSQHQLQVERVLSAWVALDDAGEDSSCMWMVPGSHRWGERARYLNGFEGLRERSEIGRVQRPADVVVNEWRDPIACPVRAGEVHFHHAHTWHASPTNGRPQARRAFTIFYVADATGAVAERPALFNAAQKAG